MKLKIAVLPGDGIGPEVMTEATRVLDSIAQGFGHTLEIENGLAGGAAYEEYGAHLPEETLQVCRKSDAILFGSVGGPVSEMDKPKWKDCERNSILTLRKEFGFAVNLRPAKIFKKLAALSPLKPEIVNKGVDMLIVRELLGDAYFGEHERYEKAGARCASDKAEYSEHQVKTAVVAGFEAARKRRGKLTSVDKANVLTTSKLWREVAHEVAKEYKDVEFEDMLVDNCAMQLMLNPAQFDVIVTSNMFGDILSDAAAALPGSLGLVASASLTDGTFGLYEPPGGSAQDIAGKGIANPIAQILSAALLLRYSFNLEDEARCIEGAVESALEAGFVTSDLSSGVQENNKTVDTKEMTNEILKFINTRKPSLTQ